MLRCISRACVIINRAIIINHPLSITSGYSQVRYLTSRHLKILSERKRLPEKLIQKACVFVRHAHCVKLQVFIHLKHFNYFPMMILLKKCFPIFWPSVVFFTISYQTKKFKLRTFFPQGALCGGGIIIKKQRRVKTLSFDVTCITLVLFSKHIYLIVMMSHYIIYTEKCET